MSKADWKKNHTKMSNSELHQLKETLSTFENTLKSHLGDIQKLVKGLEKSITKEGK